MNTSFMKLLGLLKYNWHKTTKSAFIIQGRKMVVFLLPHKGMSEIMKLTS